MTETAPTTPIAALRYEAAPIKGSRFVVDLAPVASEADAKELLSVVRQEFTDASHHCSAWRLAAPVIERANDDGEPSGSAGRPILAQLAGRDVIDVAVVVSRWFGGTKLGVGGLVRAYGGTTAQALDSAKLTPWVATTSMAFCHDYALIEAIDRLIDDAQGTLAERSFGTQVDSVVTLPLDAVTSVRLGLANLSAGTIVVDTSHDDESN